MFQRVESGTSITKAIVLPSGAHFASVGVSVRRVTWDDAPSASIQRTKIWVPLGSPSAKYRMRVPSGDQRASDPFTRNRWCDPSALMIQRAESHLSSTLLTQRRVYTICEPTDRTTDRKSTRLNSSHGYISYAVFCLKKK